MIPTLQDAKKQNKWKINKGKDRASTISKEFTDLVLKFILDTNILQCQNVKKKKIEKGKMNAKIDHEQSQKYILI